ncbi:MAG TPA: cupin domain-containing protein [Rhodocyclaceae bacterium]
MASMQKRNFTKPDETRTFDKGKVELIEMGGVTFGKATLEPGWKWSNCVKPIAHTDSCEASHLQYLLSGRLHVKMDDGSELEFGPGDLVEVAPGHDSWVVGNDPVVAVDITGLGNFAKA